MSVSSAASSVACVQDVVSRHFAVSVCRSIHSLHFCVKGPSPHIFWFSTDCLIYSISLPVNGGTLKLIMWFSSPIFCLNFSILNITHYDEFLQGKYWKRKRRGAGSEKRQRIIAQIKGNEYRQKHTPQTSHSHTPAHNPTSLQTQELHRAFYLSSPAVL